VSERFTITLESLLQGPPAIVRVRMALKTLLRRYWLRALDVRQETPRQNAQDAAKPNGMHREPSEAMNAPASRRTPAKAKSARSCTELRRVPERSQEQEQEP
jgi:hypothetical protein